MKTETKKPAPVKRHPRLLSLLLWTVLLGALAVSPLPELLCGWIGKPEHLVPVKGFVSLLTLVFALRVVFHPFRLAADALEKGALSAACRPLLATGWMTVLSLGAAACWLLLQTRFPVPVVTRCIQFIWDEQWLPRLLDTLHLTPGGLAPVLGIGALSCLGLAAVSLAVTLLTLFWRGSGVVVHRLRNRPPRPEKMTPVPCVTPPEADDALARLAQHRASIPKLNLNRPAIRICQPAAAGPVQEWLLTDWDGEGYLTFRRDSQELIFRREGENVFILGSEPLQLTPGLVYEVLVELPMPMRVMTITYIP